MKYKTVPGPKRSFIIGSAMEFSNDPPGFLNNLANEYGDIVRFYFFGRPLYMVTSPDFIRELLVTKADSFPKAKRDIDILSKFLGNGLLTSQGAFHKQQRKLTQPVFHRQRIQTYAETMVNYTDKVIENWRHDESRQICDEMMSLTMFIVAKTLFNAGIDDMAGEAKIIGQAIEDIQEVSNEEFQSLIIWPE